jgi:hypothetical protein
MSRVCGPERNGFVRSVGKGPTPRDLEMPGKEKYRSTKVQMAIEGQKQAQLEKEALIEHFERRQTQSDRKIESLSEKVERLTELLLADSRDGRQVHVNPQVLSNSATNEVYNAMNNFYYRLSVLVSVFIILGQLIFVG